MSEEEDEDDTSSMMSSEHQDLQARLNVERDLLEDDTTMLTAEKEKLRRELDAKAARLNKEKQEKEMMMVKIKAMESKLLTGDGDPNMVERTNKQQKELEKRKADIAERRKREKEHARMLEEREERDIELEKTYTSLQQEVDAKTKKLKKLFMKLQSTKQAGHCRRHRGVQSRPQGP